ncbi:MAG: hypothetical protein AVDCRST_MAG93-1733 [uncultured Chloroflexia bacterium]|uniref:Uncharacterized protein n=1 Tax=uncultured Chloroflexia bacterium TaxID=1672391 RepID=A0A6J4IGY5_9CHLR|nr:MAG: hypothetical protein AVDCRST_MAG93-1733 [uncultured Chloroflexia bacterium]
MPPRQMYPVARRSIRLPVAARNELLVLNEFLIMSAAADRRSWIDSVPASGPLLATNGRFV